MFNDTSLIKEVNIINKVVCFIIVLFIAVVCNNPLFTLFVDIFFLLITKQYNNLFKFNILTTILLALSSYYSHFLWISKIFLIIIYTILLSKVTKLTELRYVLEVTFYRFKNKKITYRLFYLIYFLKNFKRHIKRMLVLKDDYSIKLTPKFLIFIIKQSFIKASNSKKDFIDLNNERFYNTESNRTYIEKISWERWDINYLACHIVILILTYFFGR